MEILKIIETLQSYTEDAVAYKLDGAFAHAVSEAVELLVKQGERIAELEEKNRWIPVTERLPEDDSDVLAYLRIGEEGRIYPANYAKGVWWDCVFNTPATKTTTHWMPLPEPPKGD